jgi:murein DD-endopeptidase MepM/ murein hydrolase activator NlpD
MQTKFKITLALSVLIIPVVLLNNLGVFDNFLSAKETSEKSSKLKASGAEAQAEIEVPAQRFGLSVDSFHLVEAEIKNGESFSDILLNYGVDYPTIHQIATNFQDVFDLRQLRHGKPYTLFCEDQDSTLVARYMVYQPSLIDYVVFDLHDSLNVYRGEEALSIREKSVSGKIEGSLYQSIVEGGGSPALVVELSKIYAWTIDFFRIQPQDHFKVIYEEKYIHDTVLVGMGRILAADFYHEGRDFYSFWYDNEDNYRDYFDEEGRSLRKAFLKAPLEYFRISSRYNPRRFHPVLKRVKPHLGTDYAAPHGTPIMATADGEVIAAAYTRGNGNYVKIRHNSTYTTQYLHMSRFAKGISKGTRVRQGDLIGYVGSTGLATGPHVCYRFWVNGQQVDPLKQDLPEAEPIAEEYRVDYQQFMAPWKARLDGLPLDGSEKETPRVQLASAR